MSIYDNFSEQELQILQERTERAARLTSENDEQSISAALTVTLGHEVFALPISELRAVYVDVPVVPVPCVPSYVAGIANIRGRIMPVLNLTILLDVPKAAASKLGTLIVAANDDISIAFAVEAIKDTIAIQTNKLSSLSSDVTAAKAKYLQGLLVDDIALVDVQAILNDPQLQVNETVS